MNLLDHDQLVRIHERAIEDKFAELYEDAALSAEQQFEKRVEISNGIYNADISREANKVIHDCYILRTATMLGVGHEA